MLNDDLSKNFMERFHTSLAQYENVQNVATAFTDFFSPACYRAHWFDSQCREKRIETINAGARIESDRDRETLVAKCKNYRSLKQRKKRAYNKKCATEIESGLTSGTTEMWRRLSRLSQNVNRCAGPSGDEFVTHYKNLAHAPAAETFDKLFENEVMEFLDMYDTKCTRPPICDRLEFDILNGNITIEEIEAAIDSCQK